MKRSYSCLPALAAVMLTLVPPPALSQTTAGSISGRVTDSAGAVIVGAEIDLVNTALGTTTSVPSNQAGLYLFPSVQPGQYRMAARSSGFKQGEVKSLTIDIGGQVEQNFQLQVGDSAESISVESTETLVNTVSSTISSVVTGAPIQDLPLNGRDTLSLALTQPGVMPAAINTTTTSSLNNAHTFVVGGGRPSSVTYLLDGGNNTSVAYATPVVDPNPDTVQEFRILTNNYSAEFGRSAGGVVMVATKSGTNQLHGSIYDYLRNTDLNANNFFNQSGGATSYQPRPVLIRNQFGVTTGGPVTIPKLIHGKDRFFFFIGYQGQRQTAVQVQPQVTVFTPAELKGDFSHAISGAPDVGVAAFLASHPYYQANPALAAQAVIDPTKIVSAAQAYVSNNLLPVSPTGILTPNSSATDNRDEFVGKLDFHITQNDLVSVTMVRSHNPQLVPFSGANVAGYSATNTYDNYFGNAAYTKIITPTLLNDFHFTAQREFNRVGVPTKTLPGPAQLGMKITPDAVTGPPQINFTITF